jgi:hypothetical protein
MPPGIQTVIRTNEEVWEKRLWVQAGLAGAG